MTININLDEKCFGRVISEPILIPQELRIAVSSSVYAIPTYSIGVRIGNTAETFATRGEPVNISHLLRAGTLELEVKAFVRGVEVKKWNFEPVILVEAEHGFEAHPEVEELKERVAVLERAVYELSGLIQSE